MRASTKEAYQLLHQGSMALSKVEANGIRIDTKYLEKSINRMDATVTVLERSLKKDPVWKRWVRVYGQNANLFSLPQLGKVLFDKKQGLGFKNKAVTNKGRVKVDEAAIEKIDLDFCRDYIKLSRYRKARNTFLEGIRRETVGDYLHPSFNLNLVDTFRSSSSDPNFQNFPIRNKEMGELIRKCFIARKGHVLGEIDFSGIEVRAAAWYHKDPTMLKYIKDPTTDMHRDTAMKLAFLEKEQVSKAMRHTAKNKFVFPQFYGSFYIDCAQSIWEEMTRQKLTLEGSDLTVQEHLKKKGIRKLGKCDFKERPVKGTFEYHVKEIEDWFWNTRFPVYTQWKKDWWNAYLRKGYFQMFTGFVCNGLYRRNQAINYPVQGVAFHCLLWSLIQLQDWLDTNKMRTKIVGQIHDSLILDIYKPELQDVLNKAHEIMTVDLLKHWKWIITPLETETEICPSGGSWYDKKPYICKSGVWSLKA